MRKATLKASVAALAPKAAAISCSRTRPVTREASVSRETVEAALSRFIAGAWQDAMVLGQRADYRQRLETPVLYSSALQITFE